MFPFLFLLQVIAFICGVIVVLLMIMGLASTDWLMALGWRQGLFAHCIEDGAPTPLPFNIVDPPGCYQARDVGEQAKRDIKHNTVLLMSQFPFMRKVITLNAFCFLLFFLTQYTGYIKAAAALYVLCLVADIAATVLTGLGLRSQDHRDKHKYYRFAVFCMGIARELIIYLKKLF